MVTVTVLVLRHWQHESINHYNLQMTPCYMITCTTAETLELFDGTSPQIEEKTTVCHSVTYDNDCKLQDACITTYACTGYEWAILCKLVSGRRLCSDVNNFLCWLCIKRWGTKHKDRFLVHAQKKKKTYSMVLLIGCRISINIPVNRHLLIVMKENC